MPRHHSVKRRPRRTLPWLTFVAAVLALPATACSGNQALAGVIMWVPGGIVYLLAAAMVFARWLERDAREAGALGERVRHAS